MFWGRLYAESSKLWQPIRMYLGLHRSIVFRMLLLGGNLLFLIAFWYIRQIFPSQHRADLWLSGFTATLAILWLFSLISMWVNGRRLAKDPWIMVAATTMTVLSLILFVNAVVSL